MAKTAELSQPQGKAAKSDHTKPDISDKTAESTEHKGKPAKHRAKHKQNQYIQSQKAITIKTEPDQRIKKAKQKL